MPFAPVQREISLALKSQLAFVEPPNAGNSAAIKLRVERVQRGLPGGGPDGGPRVVDVLTYDGRLTGPTIRVKRGTKLRILVQNKLTGTPPAWVSAVPDQEDLPHGFYTTNLHTHGLHVSPSGSADNIFREIDPGTSFQYEYDIPANHPAGTFWYHAHNHGSVAYQLTNGMAGALIVSGNPGDSLNDLEDVPEIAKAKDVIFVLQQYAFRQQKKHSPGSVNPDDNYGSPDTDPYEATGVNGVIMPTYSLRPGEVQRWRFIHAGREELISLTWNDENGNPLPDSIFNEIAIDGIATGTITPKTQIDLYPGYRRDILFKAPTQKGTYFLSVEAPDADHALHKRNVGKPKKYLAKIQVAGLDADMKLPAAAALRACAPFTPIADGEVAQHRTVEFDFSDDAKFFHINNQSFSKQTVEFNPQLNTAEEWVLTSKVEMHPFHIHVNPFFIIQTKDKMTGAITPINEWHDTVIVPDDREITFRSRYTDFAGETVMHCHILDHEDQGMMARVNIQDPAHPDIGQARRARATTSGQLLDANRAAPALVLPAMDGTAFDLSALKSKPVVLIFFRGLECEHCFKQLRDMIAAAPGNATIVAVSERKIESLAFAKSRLKVPNGLSFHLLVDESKQSFKAFGCFDEEALHGLFVLDAAGKIRARYIGQTPFDDVKKVFDTAEKIQK